MSNKERKAAISLIRRRLPSMRHTARQLAAMSALSQDPKLEKHASTLLSYELCALAFGTALPRGYAIMLLYQSVTLSQNDTY